MEEYIITFKCVILSENKNSRKKGQKNSCIKVENFCMVISNNKKVKRKMKKIRKN